MTAEPIRDLLITPEEYLDGELRSETKHEYISGVVYAMAGGRNVHNQIVGNVFGSLHARLKGKPCLPFNSDTKVRIRLPNQLRFYYPDVQVICQPNPPEDSFQDHPVIIIEVLSDSTRRTDQGEKLDGYLTISSLENYLLVETGSPLVIGYRRSAAGFIREVHSSLTGCIALPAIGTDLPLAEIYERISFSPAD